MSPANLMYGEAEDVAAWLGGDSDPDDVRDLRAALINALNRVAILERAQLRERSRAVETLARFGADVIASHRSRKTGVWVQPSLLALPDIARDTGVTVLGGIGADIQATIDSLLDRGGAE